MRFVTRSEIPLPGQAIRATLNDLEGWSRWVPGCLAAQVEPQPDGGRDITLRLRAPRLLTLRIAVREEADGLSYQMVEGDAITASGVIRVFETDAGGCDVSWEQELLFPVSVPRPLLRELQDETAPRWLAALARAATGRT